jgi:hypothetical protein
MSAVIVDSSAVGAYAVERSDRENVGKVAIEINDGTPFVIAYLEPEEAMKLADDLVTEASMAMIRNIKTPV